MVVAAGCTKGTATVTYKLTSEKPMSKTRNLNFHGTINGRGKPKKNKGKFPWTRKVNSWSHGCQVTFGSIFRDEILAIIGTSLNDETLKALHGVNRKTSTCDTNRADCKKCPRTRCWMGSRRLRGDQTKRRGDRRGVRQGVDKDGGDTSSKFDVHNLE